MTTNDAVSNCLMLNEPPSTTDPTPKWRPFPTAVVWWCVDAVPAYGMRSGDELGGPIGLMVLDAAGSTRPGCSSHRAALPRLPLQLRGGEGLPEVVDELHQKSGRPGRILQHR